MRERLRRTKSVAAGDSHPEVSKCLPYSRRNVWHDPVSTEANQLQQFKDDFSYNIEIVRLQIRTPSNIGMSNLREQEMCVIGKVLDDHRSQLKLNE
ncbi:hypothetical protein AVEN_85821-1 [Araneus ventricosus]|uniref:Uncharacterized protein n=1 Tax=Araneus ventricosus TaxID=182803 RepID=A0A4Y2TSJ6_ARAVE|nr:hypothetical protein AVEN_264445-1 [Araneus ventricosus]GBO02645.1 hypothetical protein AVEN_85821-1 [Araneus ventricosus]